MPVTWLVPLLPAFDRRDIYDKLGTLSATAAGGKGLNINLRQATTRLSTTEF